MRLRAAAYALVLSALLPVSADAATTVLGGGQAQTCFDEAEAGRATDYGLSVCTGALEGEPLARTDRAATFVNRGVIHLQRRNGRAALADFDSAQRLAPDLGDVHVNRGAALLLVGRIEEAETALNRGIELGSTQPQDAYFNRAVAREARGDLKGAYRDFVEAARLAPDWPAPKTELARFSVSRPGQ